MDDLLKPSDPTFRSFYERGYCTWYEIWSKVVADDSSRIATDSSNDFLTLRNTIFPNHPILPVGLEPDGSGLVTAQSTWTIAGECRAPTPFSQTLRLLAAVYTPATIRLDPELPGLASEIPQRRGGHVTVLTLAWTYVLSARWADIISGASPITYTNSLGSWVLERNEPAEDAMVVQLPPNTGPDTARWWAAVLAKGRGWSASLGRSRLLSPWSVTLDCKAASISITGCIEPREQLPDRSTPPSFTNALAYIEEYCEYHQVYQECDIALAAALQLPVARTENRRIPLYTPRGHLYHPTTSAKHVGSPNPVMVIPRAWSTDQIDRLLALGINPHGVKAVLGSIFYEPGISANVCGAWLQGSWAVIYGKGMKSDFRLLFKMLQRRNPSISFLWLGALVSRAYKQLLGRTLDLLGLNRIELHAAFWTNVSHTFIEEPFKIPPLGHTSIPRGDECRTMFLAQEPPRDYPPIYAYPPLGETDIKDTDLGVQLHVQQCAGKAHQLSLVSVTWPCSGSRKVRQPFSQPRLRIPSKDPAGELDYAGKSATQKKTTLDIDYSFMDRSMEESEIATANIFLWMREVNGYTVKERAILQHEWVYRSESEDDEKAPVEGDGASVAYRPRGRGFDVAKWMAGSVTKRSDSL